MKSFWKLTALSLQSQMYYRTSLILNLLTPIVTLLGQYLLWKALYAQQAGCIGGMERNAMFSYILISFALNNLISWSTENNLSREIKAGTVVSRCVRPVSFLSQSLSGMLGAAILQGIVNFMIVLIGFAAFSKHLVMPTLCSVVAFLPCFFLSVLLRMMLIDVFSLICFFSTGYLGISWTRQALTDFFSGALIPIAMFPGWLQKIVYSTPFPYMLQTPIAILLGQEIPVKLYCVYLFQVLWLIVFLILHMKIYGHVRRNMNIAGG